MSDLFLGFDLSTQQLKIVSIFTNLKPFKVYAVTFSKDLPHYNTENGVYRDKDGVTINAPVDMWLEAIDMIFTQMREDDFPFAQVKGVSGSCQQHGSVFWSSESEKILSNLEKYDSLKSALFPGGQCIGFTNRYSPNWQDHSTIDECIEFNAKSGGESKLASLTGSKAYHRFTGPQIKKFLKTKPEDYKLTYKITLVSNFLSSILLGKFAKIDEADACGMNIYDVKARQWNKDLLSITCSGGSIDELESKLNGSVEPVGYKSAGNISKYFQDKYGFSKDCQVYPFTGDNLATILSLPLGENDLLVSLGTSTTLLLITNTFKPNKNYHVMIHPTNPKLYMNMICYSNGALPRNFVKDNVNRDIEINDEWQKFNKILDSNETQYQSALNGEIGVFFPQGEIIPNIDKPLIVKYKFDTKTGELIERIGPVATELKDLDPKDLKNVKAIVESQALSCRIRTQQLLEQPNGTSLLPRKLIFVGGSSKNFSIIKKFALILGSQSNENFRGIEPNSCALGGAFKACWSLLKENNIISEGIDEFLNKEFDKSNLQKFDVESGLNWHDYDAAEKALRNLEKII